MSLSTIYGKSGKGAQVLTGKSKSLPADSMRVLAQIDGKSNAGAIMAALEKFSEQELTQILTQLLSGGYIRVIADDSIKDFFPDSGIASTIDVVEISTEEFLKTEASAHALDSDVKIRQQKEAEARAKAHAEEQLKLEATAHAQKESERKLLEATDLLANSSDEIDIEKLAEQKAREEAAAKAKAEAEAKAKREAEEKARREAEARAKREAEEKAKREAEERARLAAEQKAREEAEAKAKREAEEKARREAEARAKREAEEKAKREAEERARLAAEQKAREEAEAKAKREAEEKARREAEARAKREAEEKAKREAEERARLAAEQKAREGAEEAVLRAKAEMQARAEYVAGEKVQEETELLAEQGAKEKARVVAEEKEREEAERIARKHAEAEEKAAAKLEARNVAEELAQEETKEWEEREPIDLNRLLRTVFRISRKLFISVSVTALVLLFLLQLVNLSMLVSPLVGPIQKLVSENINEPVTINKVYASLWPKPHLVLDGVAIGGLADIKITTIRVLPELSTVLDDVKTLRYIELSGLTVSQDNLHRPLQWVSAATKQGKLKFDQVFLEKTAVSLHGLEAPPFDGDIKLTPAGKFQSATLNTGDKSIIVQIAPKDETYTIDIVADNWQSPIGAPVVFDELHAVGAIDNNQLTFSQIKGRLYGGNLKATMTVDWTSLWTATGSFKLSEVELEEAMPSFTKEASLKGPITSTATFTLEANEMPALFDAPAINADFSIDDGAINGIDFVRALRANNKNNAINGSTRFNKFSGKLWLKDGRYQYKQLLLKAGKLTASGEADIQANQNISGTIDVSLAMQSRQLQSHLNLSGKLGSPTLR